MISRRSLLLQPAAHYASSKCTSARNDITLYSLEREKRLFHGPPPVVVNFGSKCTFIATVHTTNPGDTVFSLIDRFAPLNDRGLTVIEGFPTTLGLNPTRVFTAASLTSVSNTSFAAGELGYAVRRVQQRHGYMIGGEPTDEEVARSLIEEGFTLRDVVYASMLGPLAQDFRAAKFEHPSGEEFDKAFAAWATTLWYPDSFRPSSQDFSLWYKNTFGLSIVNDDHWVHRNSPVGAGRVSRLIGRRDELRDTHIFSTIFSYGLRSNHVTVIYGAGHLVSMWTALKSCFGRALLVDTHDLQSHG